MFGSVIGGHNIQIGSATGDVIILLDRPNYRLEFLTPTVETDKREPPRGPSYLLDPQQRVVGFRPRPAAQERLQGWFEDPARVSVVLVTGPGGQGKTRLANHVASACNQAGWGVAQAVERSPQLRAGYTNDQVLAGDQALLVVVDYAERWQLEVLVQLVETLPLDYPGRRVRVLLLARPAPALWDDIAAQLDRSDVDLPDPIPLAEFELTEREAAFTDAAREFARRLQVATPPTPSPETLADPAYGSPLTLHMAALAAAWGAREHQTVPARPDELSQFLLRHERRYWIAVSDRHARLVKIERMVLLGTLLGPVSGWPAALGLLRRAGLADGDAEADDLLDVYELCYPPQTSAATLGPLRPDRFGEDFIGLQLANRPHAEPLLIKLLGEPDLAALDRWAVRRCLIVLAAAADRHDSAAATLFKLLQAHPYLVEQASATVVQLVEKRAPDAVAVAVEDALPRYSTELLRPAAALARRLHETLPDDASQALRARRLNNLGVRLSEVGDKWGALASTQEAVATYRQLAKAEPVVYQPDLASALNNLGVQLSGVGDKRGALVPAQEAVATYRQLAEAQPAVYLPDLASALNNLGTRLSEAGDKRDALAPAQEAVATYRQLAEAQPAVYLPDLASALNNLGTRLSEAGDKRDALAPAQEAVAIRRRLAEAEPAVYLPDLALSLNNLGVQLSGVGDTQDALASAQEAVATYRRLAVAEPAAYLPALALSLGTFGWVRAAAQLDPEAALAAVQKTITAYRFLAAALPEALSEYLRNAVVSMADILDALGRPEEANELRHRLDEKYPR